MGQELIFGSLEVSVDCIDNEIAGLCKTFEAFNHMEALKRKFKATGSLQTQSFCHI